MKKTLTLLAGVSGVNAEKSKRVDLKPGVPYELVSMKETRPGTFAVAVLSPDETHLGGSDGKTPHPCTIWAQVPAAAISPEKKKAAASVP